jgi:hypothetical protein
MALRCSLEGRFCQLTRVRLCYVRGHASKSIHGIRNRSGRQSQQEAFAGVAKRAWWVSMSRLAPNGTSSKAEEHDMHATGSMLG